MNIIIEGPDGAGKTTFATKGFKDYQYHHEGPPSSGYDLLKYYTNLLDQWDNTIFDRHALSELVYGPLLRGQSRVSFEEVDLLYNYQKKDRLIICLPPPEVCEANWSRAAGRGLELFTSSILFWKSYAAFGYYAHKLGVQIFDYTSHTFASHLEGE